MQDQPRLHVSPERGLAGGNLLPMHEREARYLGQVLRLAPGDLVRLFNAPHGEWPARFERLPRRGGGRFVVTERLRPAAAEPGPILLFAPVKRDATDLIVRMATELGATALQPVLTERTNSARVNTDRLEAIAAEAAEQCERLSVPRVAAPQRLMAVLGEWPPERLLCAAIERLPAGRLRFDPAAAEALLIGPEGGFTSRELDVLNARPFVTAISLGPRILRAETAALVGLARLQGARERWDLVQTAPQFGFEPSPGGGQQIPLPPSMPAEPDVEPK